MFFKNRKGFEFLIGRFAFECVEPKVGIEAMESAPRRLLVAMAAVVVSRW